MKRKIVITKKKEDSLQTKYFSNKFLAINQPILVFNIIIMTSDIFRKENLKIKREFVA